MSNSLLITIPLEDCEVSPELRLTPTNGIKGGNKEYEGRQAGIQGGQGLSPHNIPSTSSLHWPHLSPLTWPPVQVWPPCQALSASVLIPGREKPFLKSIILMESKFCRCDNASSQGSQVSLYICEEDWNSLRIFQCRRKYWKSVKLANSEQKKMERHKYVC